MYDVQHNVAKTDLFMAVSALGASSKEKGMLVPRVGKAHDEDGKLHVGRPHAGNIGYRMDVVKTRERQAHPRYLACRECVGYP